MQNRRRFPNVDDDTLVTRTQEGDTSAFTELVERYYTSCLKLAASILRHPQNAEDEVQNACWKAFQHIHQFQRDAKFSTWLTRIVVNQCLMRLRQQRRSRVVYMDSSSAAEDVRLVDFPSNAPSPELEVGRSEVAQILAVEISRIPPLLRKVYVLRDVQDLPMPEVAGRLGISVAAAKSRLLRAREELRSRLRKYEGRLGPATLLA